MRYQPIKPCPYLDVYFLMKYMFIKVVDTSEIEVAHAAPISPNIGIKITFNNVFKVAHIKLIRNIILT